SRRAWTTRRAARVLRDLPRDRRVPAERGGGSMSVQSPTTPPTKSGQLKETERIQAGPGPGRGPFGGGMVGQKASTFGPSAKRLIGRMAPDRIRAIAVVVLAVVSVLLTAVGPK